METAPVYGSIDFMKALYLRGDKDEGLVKLCQQTLD
jgi:hypothetical protein